MVFLTSFKAARTLSGKLEELENKVVCKRFTAKCFLKLVPEEDVKRDCCTVRSCASLDHIVVGFNWLLVIRGQEDHPVVAVEEAEHKQ